MGKFEDGILGLVSETDWLSIPFSPVRPNDPTDQLFSDEKTNNIAAKWQTIAAEYQTPVMAQFHGFDTQAKTTFRIPVDTHSVEKGLIKVKINQSERMRTLLHSGVRQDDLYNYVINDGYNLAQQVITRSKVAKNELLATGHITIKENNLDLNVDYGVPKDNVDIAFAINDNAKTDVPAQIQEIVDKASDLGVTINGMYTSKKTISRLRTNKSIETIINGSNSLGAQVRRSDLDTYLSEEFGIDNIILNDLKYGSQSTIGKDGRPVIKQERYFPQDKITFFGTANTAAGNSSLGTGLWGDPPEVVGVQAQTGATASSSSPYVYITQWTENDPAELWTKASALYMPVLYNPYSLFIAKVTA